MRFLLAFLLLASSVSAGPKQLVKSFGAQVKRTFYTDLKAHPYAWTLNMGIQVGAMFADTSTSCMLTSSQYIETGTSRFFVGRSPLCHKFVALNLGQIIVAMPAENWLAHKFDDSCKAQAASHDPRWDNTPAHTHDPNCFWAVPVGFSIGSFATSYGSIKGNINLIQEKK